MKKLSATLALLLSSVAAMAVIPQEERAGRDLTPCFSKTLFKVAKNAADTDNKNSFFEGFEGRDPAGYGFSANAWLPDGWSQFSRQGNKHVKSGEGYWDLTWLTLSNESVGHLPAGNQTQSFEGEAFAYIMADVMWGEKNPYPDLGLDYATNHPQDEWLVTPEFTPAPEEWFYFKLQFRPGWCLYNREANDFTGETTLLEVYVTEGDGTTDASWTRLWSLKDYIVENYTQEQLHTDMVSFESPDYESIYVKISDYVGKNVRVAFRFFGVNGQGMALDNVSLGIPYPKPSYAIPTGFMKQQSLTPLMTEITGTPQLLIPFDAEATWRNTSRDVLTCEWTYDNPDGSKATSDVRQLVTPPYEVGRKYDAPVLKGFFESRSATFTTPYSSMQAGGRLYGKGDKGYDGELGVAAYDYLDPKGELAQNSSTIAFHKGTNEQWETLMGRVPNTLDIKGMGCMYPATPQPYGFDYVDVFAQIVSDDNGVLSPETVLVANIIRLPEDEYTDDAVLLGQGVLTGKDINEFPDLEPGYNYKNLRFKLDVPVYADGNILVLLFPANIEGNDKIVFPYMRSEDDNVWGNSVVYLYVYESEENGGTYDTFYNLNSYPLSKGHFAGLTMSLGACYSYMDAPSYNGETVSMPLEGGEYKLDIRSMFPPEKWTLSADGLTTVSWATVTADADPVETDLYHATISFDPSLGTDGRDTDLYISQPGSRVILKYHQEADPAGITDVTTDDVTLDVKVVNGAIVVNGAAGSVSLYNLTGIRIAEARTAAGSVSIDATRLGSGVYIVRSGNATAKVVL